MLVKTRNLQGASLDWAIAVIGEYEESLTSYMGADGNIYLATKDGYTHMESRSWAQGGPIMSSRGISRTTCHSSLWIAYWTDGYTEGDEGKLCMQCDKSELVAGLRYYVALELGDEVDIPEELINR